MTFIPETALEAAMVAANNDPRAQGDFYRLLLASEIFLLGKTDPPILAGMHATPAGMTLMLGEVSYKGEQYHPVFSSESRLLAFRPKPESSFWMIGRDVFRNTPGAQFLLNPKSELMWTLKGSEILKMYGAEPRG